MDLRFPVLAILCGGAPAPGINGVISSVTIEALNSNCSVLGFFEGFKQLKLGKSMAMDILFNDVTRIHSTGGSMLRTSKQQLSTPQHVDNCLRVLQHHRVRYLVTVGGTQTAYSASLIVNAAAAAKYKLSVVHVPKSIFDDMGGCRTFGFSTAREEGAKLVQSFANDARTMLRWYILVTMGQKAGNLTLGIGKAGASTVTIIAEDFMHRRANNPLTFSELATILEGAIYKRRAMNKEYGVACISEGLVSCFDPKELAERFGDLDTAHSELGRHLVIELQRRFAKRHIEQTVVARNIGAELRSQPPNASDMVLTRDLGFAAARVLMEGGNNCIVTIKGGSIHVIPFSAILDPAHSSTHIRLVDTSSLSYQVAQSYSIMLRQPDLLDTSFLQKLARAANLPPSEFLLMFQGVAASAAPFRQPQIAGVNYSFMGASAFPQLSGGPTSTSAAQQAAAAAAVQGLGEAATAAAAQALVDSLSPQTKLQLQHPPPGSSAQHIVTAPSRKGSERDSLSASPPYHLMASGAPAAAAAAAAGSPALTGVAALHAGQLHLNLPGPHSMRGSSAGVGPSSSSAHPHAGLPHNHNLPAQHPILPSGVDTQGLAWFQSSREFASDARLSSSSPTPPHMLSSGAETPGASAVASGPPGAGPTPRNAAASPALPSSSPPKGGFA